MTQNHWKRLNTLQHYKVPGGVGLGGRPPPGSQPGKEPSLCSPPHQVPDGATVGLIPQLHNGGAISQSLAQSCPFGESESHGPEARICPQELEAGRQESWSCHWPCLGLPSTLPVGKPKLQAEPRSWGT